MRGPNPRIHIVRWDQIAAHGRAPHGHAVRLEAGRARERSDCFLELLGRAERDFLACLDLDRLAGRRIASHPAGAVAHLQDADPAEAEAVALLQVLDDTSYQLAEDRLGLLFRDLMGLGKLRREMLEGD